MATDVRIWTGTAWESIKGPPGPTVVSADAGNVAKLGADGRISVQPADMDARWVNVTGDTMTGPLIVQPAVGPAVPDGSLRVVGDQTNANLVVQRNDNGGHPSLFFNRTRGTTAAQTIVQSGDILGAFGFNTIRTDGARAQAGYLAQVCIETPEAGDLSVRSNMQIAVGTGTGGQLVIMKVDDTGVSISGNITSTGTAHNFAANSITASAILGLPAAATVAPLANAAASSVGISTAYARQDHVHPLPTAAQTGAITQAQADARYVELTGDWMSGPLALGGSAAFTTTAPLDIDATTYRLRQPKTPASQTDIGEQGTVCWDNAYLYCCVAPNQWRRQAWSDWSGAVTGAAWAPLTTASPPQFAIGFGGSTFVADSGRWSVDGANWYAGTGLPAYTLSTWNIGGGHTRPAFGNGTFVLAARNGGSGNASFYTSSDGKAWTQRTITVGTGSNETGLRAVGFGGGRFVSMINSTGLSTANVTPRHSVDGITWGVATVAGLPASSLTEVTGVAHSGGAAAGLFVSVGRANGAATNDYLTSPDGVTWTARTFPLTLAWNDVAFGNGRFVAISSGLAALTSVDGVNWTQVNMPASADWETLVYGGGKWIAVAPNSTNAAISSDGITWTTIALPASSAWNGIATNGTVFVATGGAATPAILTPNPQLVTYFPITASRTLVASDNNATVANVTTSATPVTLTIPTNAALAFPIGTSITVMDASSTASTTIKADAGVTLNWSGKLIGTSATVLGGVGAEVQIPGPLSQVVLRKVAADSWTILY